MSRTSSTPRRLAASAVFRPLKGRALDRVLAGGQWPSEEVRRYITQERCAGTVIIPMIESVAAVEDLDAICSIPGVHVLFVGPNDLTVNARPAAARAETPAGAGSKRDRPSGTLD